MQILVKEWIISIVVISILGSFVDIILPNSSFRKYTKFVFGLMLLVIIIRPILNILSQDISIESIISNNSLDQEAQFFNQQDSLSDIYSEQIKDLFISNMKNNLKIQLKQNFEIEECDLTVVLLNRGSRQVEADIDYIEINNIIKSNSISTIKHINIDTDEQVNRTSPVDLSQEESYKIKAFISEYYGVNKDQIIVNY